ncbi:hypothetical protein DB347_19365 [Opitutaceae bacterium EW11]|nr:hypothetical protein DB347_19365 [Opitutaceae bacterium EW11]
MGVEKGKRGVWSSDWGAGKPEVRIPRRFPNGRVAAPVGGRLLLAHFPSCAAPKNLSAAGASSLRRHAPVGSQRGVGGEMRLTRTGWAGTKGPAQRTGESRLPLHLGGARRSFAMLP